jgi:DNA-binding CsgD family transcriptional regulator
MTTLEADETALCKLYGMTRAEAALVTILLPGKSLDEAAAALSIGPHVARTHMKRILMKVDTQGMPNLTSRLPRKMPKAERPCVLSGLGSVSC